MSFMSHQTQARLAKSTDGGLVLSRWSPASVPSILRLPEEILFSILEFAALGNVDPSKNDISQICSLVLVCRRFNLLANAFLYRSLEFEYHLRAAPVDDRDVLLHRTLQENPSLRSLCREVSITVHDRGDDFGHSIRVSHDFLSWITNSRELIIITTPRAAYSPGMGELLRAINLQVPRIEYIRFKGTPFVRSLETIVTSFLAPSFKKLSIDSLSFSELITRPLREPNVMQAAGSRKPFLLSAEQRWTAAVTTLILHNFNSTFKDLEQILKWPRNLKHLHICLLTPSRARVGDRTPKDKLSSVFAPQSASLHNLDLSGFSVSPWNLDVSIDASLFPSLTRLMVSRYTVRPDSDPTLMLAPELAVFGWDGSHGAEDQCILWPRLYPAEADWLELLVATAIQKSIPLRRIELRFYKRTQHTEACMYADISETFDNVCHAEHEDSDYLIPLLKTTEVAGIALEMRETFLLPGSMRNKEKEEDEIFDPEPDYSDDRYDNDMWWRESIPPTWGSASSVIDGADIRQYFPRVELGNNV